MMWVARSGSVDIVKKLMRAKADINVKDEVRHSVFHPASAKMLSMYSIVHVALSSHKLCCHCEP